MQRDSVYQGWKESFSSFVSTVKMLEAYDMTNLGQALKTSFDHLNQFRLQTNIDNYGQGRNPAFIDPAMVGLSSTSCCKIEQQTTDTARRFRCSWLYCR
jgi:hypothetical protein